jgi:heme-degrading monooxygenase HmoA
VAGRNSAHRLIHAASLLVVSLLAADGRIRMMIVCIDSLQVAPERIDEMISRYRKSLRHMHLQTQGLMHQYWLIDRHSGQIKIVDLWESQEDMEAAIPTLEAARAQLWSEFQEALQQTPTFKVYEVAERF